MPCRGVSLPEMGCPAMDLFCFFVERKKFFFFILQIFPIKLLGLRLSSGLKVQNYKGGFHAWQQLFCFRENVPGTRDLEKKIFESSVEVLEKNLAVRFPL